VDAGDTSAITLGVRFVPAQDGYIDGVRFYKSAANTGTHTASLWTAGGTRLATTTFTGESTSGWQTASFARPVRVSGGTTYVIGYYAPVGHYSSAGQYFATDYVAGPLTVPGGNNGVYVYGGDAFPTSSFNSTNYWVDPIFDTTGPVNPAPPSVVASNPLAGSTSNQVTVAPTVTFDQAVDPKSVAVTMTDANGTTINGTVSVDATETSVTITPSNPLQRGTKYTVTVSASDPSGNAMPTPYSFSFTTAQPATPPGVCPCTVWDDATTPSVTSSTDNSSVDVGVRFTADVSGQVLGLRFYKGAGNTGTHTGTLWSSAGQQLATGTFTGESTSGWQTLTFGIPVSIAANTTYIVSYHAPNGAFAYDLGAFSTSGVDQSPLHIPAHAGVYLYGTGGFPTQTSDANYWVDPVFNTDVRDTTPPVISSIGSATSGSTATISWTTDENSTSRVDYGTSPSTLSGTATVSGQSTAHSVPLTGLASDTTYYFRVTSADGAGNTSTAPNPPAAPASFHSADTVPPVISAVSASGRSGSATITWTTNENSSSRVDYGTSAGSLTSNATSAGQVTAHSVQLTGLAASTTYYYRVTSADVSNNSATSPTTGSNPATFATTVASVGDTTTADFSAGNNSSTYESDNGNGEVVLAPSAASEFPGTTLPSGMTTTVRSGGSVVVAGGKVTVQNADLSTTATYSSGRSLETLATLARSQSIGFVTSSNSNVQLSLSVTTANALVATVNDGFTGTSSSTIATGWTAAPHVFRIEWNSTSVTFYLDNVSKYSHSFNSFYPNLRPRFSDTVTGDAGLAVDWFRVGPYAASGTFTSRVLDAGASLPWGAMTWDATVPTGTSMTVRVRTGNTASPDGTWSAFTTVTASGSTIGRSSRYLQYQVSFTSSGTRFVSPALRSTTFAFPV